jgi:FixJ family two-component response regulator
MDKESLICVVDDDAVVRDSLSDLLRAAGYRAASFDSAESFLGSVDSRCCGCVVADIQMPGVTGIDLAKRVVATTDAPKIILITGHPEETWRERAMRSGASGFLRKPIDARSLFALIEGSAA